MNDRPLAFLLTLIFTVGGLASPALALGQSPAFTHAKLGLRKKRDQRYLRHLKLYAADSRADVFLKYQGKSPSGKGDWVIFDEVGGQVKIFDWQSDQLCAQSVQAQRWVEVSCLPDTSPGWRITTPSDTFRLAGFRAANGDKPSRCTLHQVMHLAAGETSMPLTAFTYLPADRKWLEVEDLGSLDDITPQVRILATLIAAIHLPRLPREQEYSAENR